MGILEIASSGVVSVAGMLIAAVIFVGIVVALVAYIQKERRYRQFKVEIWQKDGFGNLTIKYDIGGVFVDGRTNYKRLFLKNNNVGLDPDNIPFLMDRKGVKKVLLLQTGLKNFRYLRPTVNDELIVFTVGEEDVNWGINSYEAQKKRMQGWLLQYLPFIMIAFTSMIILIMIIQVLNKFAVLQDISKNLIEAAKIVAQARSGTTVLP
jgi:hypothetical protein